MVSKKVFLFSLAGFALFLVPAVYFNSGRAAETNSAPLIVSSLHNVAPQTSAVLPISLNIPAIKVDATIEYLGVTAGGAMDVTKGPDNVAWYKLGTVPGNVGSAVLAGHFGWKNNLPAVFDDLSKLKQGDKIYIVDAQNITTAFSVRELRDYGKNDDAASIFNSTDGKAHLNLITCEGTWDSASKSYSKRLVVFSDKE